MSFQIYLGTVSIVQIVLNKSNMNKDTLQAEALHAWVAANYIGLVLLPTGVGKTRVGRMCHDVSNSASTIIVTSRVAILDG